MAKRPRWVEFTHRHALTITFWTMIVTLVILIASIVTWAVAALAGWLESVAFVSHVSMAALVFAAIAGLGGVAAAVISLFPGDEDLTSNDS